MGPGVGHFVAEWVACKTQALFVRYDVFTALSTPSVEATFRALAWYTVVSGWAVAHPEVRFLNSCSALHLTNKAHVLCLARAVGLSVPSTLITNDYRALCDSREPRIAKPVNGGDYARELGDVMRGSDQRYGSLAAPAIVQERLVPPEVRIYAIAGRFMAFQLMADALDYRSTPECKVVALPLAHLETGLIDRLEQLMKKLRMDFGAADFKMSPTTGRLCFLEINSGPMFAAFDAVSNSGISDAIIDFLVGGVGDAADVNGSKGRQDHAAR